MEEIFNADELGLFCQCIPDKIYHLKREKRSGGKKSNVRVEKQPPEVFYKKKGVLKNFQQNSQETTCARASFLLKKRLWHRCFPVNFAKFVRTPFLQNTSGRLLLYRQIEKPWLF